MRLDELARSATDALLDDTRPDPASGLARLKRASRRRTTARVTAAGAMVAALLGGWLLAVDDDTAPPEPAEPVVRNGTLLVTHNLEPLRTVLSSDRTLDLPDDLYPHYDSTFTADGRVLVYTSADGWVKSHDVVTGAERELWDCGGTRQCFWAVSPDAELLAMAVDAGIEVHDLDEGSTTLLRTPEPPGAYLDWSPDGRSILFSGADSLYTIGSDGSDIREVTPIQPVHFEFPRAQWSPDGESVAFVDATPLEEPTGPTDLVESSYALRVVGRDGDGLRTLQDLGVCICLGLVSPDIAWAPDGSAIAFTKVGRIRSHGVHLLDLETGVVERLHPDGNGFLAWQPVVE